MFAVVRIKGKQFKVSENSIINAPLMDDIQEGKEIIIDEVLAVEKDGKMQIGSPSLENVEVTAKVIGMNKGPKVSVFRKKRRTGYKKKTGFRAKFTQLKVVDIKEKS